MPVPNYEDLEGKTVVYENSFGDRYNCIVTGFDYYLGITLQAKDDPNVPDGTYIYCYRGPMTPLNGKPESYRAKENKKHKKSMERYAECIRKNLVIVSNKQPSIFDNDPSTESCPFSQ